MQSLFVWIQNSEPELRILDPATAELLGTGMLFLYIPHLLIASWIVPEMGLAETKEAIDAAAKAFPSWSKTTAKVCVTALKTTNTTDVVCLGET
jgi:acyl-CoA reductase-like NAD-dependent aldehyde dehydrogenase